MRRALKVTLTRPSKASTAGVILVAQESSLRFWVPRENSARSTPERERERAFCGEFGFGAREPMVPAQGGLAPTDPAGLLARAARSLGAKKSLGTDTVAARFDRRTAERPVPGARRGQFSPG